MGKKMTQVNICWCVLFQKCLQSLMSHHIKSVTFGFFPVHSLLLKSDFMPHQWYSCCITSLKCCNNSDIFYIHILYLRHLVVIIINCDLVCPVSILTFSFPVILICFLIFTLIILACGKVNSRNERSYCFSVWSYCQRVLICMWNIDLQGNPHHTLVTDFHSNSIYTVAMAKCSVIASIGYCFINVAHFRFVVSVMMWVPSFRMTLDLLATVCISSECKVSSDSFGLCPSGLTGGLASWSRQCEKREFLLHWGLKNFLWIQSMEEKSRSGSFLENLQLGGELRRFNIL